MRDSRAFSFYCGSVCYTAKMLSEKVIRDFLILWATIDPISTLLIFAALTKNLDPTQRKRIALKAILYSGTLLIASIVIGQIILTALGIRMVSFQVAGGIILFMFAVQLIFGKLGQESSSAGGDEGDIAVFPLAIPSIATPGAIMAVILLTDNHIYPIATQVGTAIITVFVLFITYLMMRGSDHILKILGRQGSEILIRVMGLILAALSVQLIFDAIEAGNLF